MAAPVLFGVGMARLVSPHLPAFAEWVRAIGPWAPPAYVAAYAVAVICMLPVFLLTMASGAVFGVAEGSLLTLAGASIGGTLAFVLGRTAMRGWVVRSLARHPTLSMIDSVVKRDGLWLMFLLRLSPAVPFVLSNYALGATSVRLRHFVLAMIGMLPVIGSYAAIGYASSGGLSGDKALPSSMLVLGIAATVVLGILLTRITQRALKETTIGSGRQSTRITR